MPKISIFRTVFIALLLLLGVTGGVAAAPPAQEPPGDVATLDAVSTAFTYQGNLTDGAGPADGAYDFEFGLYDAVSVGSQVGSTVTKADKTVTDGLFSVELDFGSVFDGTALWLQINVRPGASTGTYTALDPRQPLTATPYALYALNVATHDHQGESWTGTGTGLTLSGGTIGLNASGATYGVRGESASTSGYGVSGLTTAGSGFTRGVSGESASTDGLGVFGNAYAGSGSTIGVYGQNSSTAGKAVQGDALATTGATVGVYGTSASISNDAKGVYGSASSTLGGSTYGVYGVSQGSSGKGVYGLASGASTSMGVFGDATYTGNSVTYGVYGRSASNQGIGVRGFATNASGINYGVYGRSYSPDGNAVYGINTSGGYAGNFAGPVKVTGFLNTNFNYGGYLNRDGAGDVSNVDTSSALSIWAEYDILARYFYAVSDARIKNIQGRSDGAADLATLDRIEITDYTLKDVIANGSDPVKKVIGQQVAAVYPQAVNQGANDIPDIYQQAAIKDGWVEIATDLQPGERVRLIGEQNEGIYEVLEVTQDGFRTDFVTDGDEVFVYGREVNDFLSVDYDAIAMLNVSASQELHRLVEQQAAEIEALNIRLAALEQAVSSDNAASRAESHVPLSPWLLLGGLGVVGLVLRIQK